MTMAEVASTENAGLPVRGAGRSVGADEPTVELPTWPLRERLAWVRRFRRAVVAGQDELIALAGEEVRKDAFETLVFFLVMRLRP